MEEKPTSLGIVLLAAGQSSRMGMPKQLLIHERTPLIRHQVNLLLQLQLPLCVVLGARAALIAPVIEDLPVRIVTNEDWESGMAGSLRCGLDAFTDLTGVLFCVVDQPYLNLELMQSYLNGFRTHERPAEALIAARYHSGKIGVPALFGGHWYAALRQLAPEYGARQLIRAELDRVETIDFPAGDFDLDRPEDWDTYRKGR